MSSQLSPINSSPSVEMHIEELVLHGFPSSDRHRIGDAMQRELTRLFTEESTPSLAKSAAIDRLNAGTFQTTGTARPEAIGAQVARAVFGGLKQ